MKKFIKNLAVFLLIIGSLLAALNFAYTRLNRANADDTAKFAQIPELLDVCNFGSSHALYGFNYEAFGAEYDCFNFALTSQNLSYDLRLFEEYGEHIGAGTTVYITVSYFSLFGDPETVKDEFAAKNKRYYSILSPSRVKEYRFTTDVAVHYLPILGADAETLIKTFAGKNRVDRSGEVWEKVTDEAAARRDAEDAAWRHITKHKLDENGVRFINEEELDALYRLVRGCRERGAKPILVTTPFLKEYTDEVAKDPSFYPQFYALMERVTRELETEYFDYAFDERFQTAYALFMGSDHLNREGAAKFTEILLRETGF